MESNGLECGDNGCHPIDEQTGAMIWAEVQGAQRTRAANMPTEQRAIHALFDAWYRLKELGWREAMYAPKDGTICEFVECGSTGTHRGHVDANGIVWLHSDGDLWPATPVLFRQVSP